MPGELIRIFSDIHFGDRASWVQRLAQVRPLLDGVDRLVLNGDTMDTRRGPAPAYTAECRAQMLDFFHRHSASTTYLTGNHDADLSSQHHLDLAGGSVFVVHGDVFFDEIVPWGRDAALISRLIADELRQLPPALAHDMEQRLLAFRRVAASIPQRHQSERNVLKYAVRFFSDVFYPPRLLNVLRAWRQLPIRANEFVQRHRPQAKFILTGHTHRPGVWPMPSGVSVINTGSFCPPFGGCTVDLLPDSLTIRRIVRRAGEFRPGSVIAHFPLPPA